MATKTKQWSTGTGSATIQYGGQGDGTIIITSDPNSVYEARSMQITVETTDGSGIQKTITVNQAAKQRIDLSAAVVTASNQTYSGSAKTPTPTVTLNGSTVPSSGYDVNYSNNTNAGTATITVTGKGDYTGTAYGTFTINKATPSYTAPSLRTGLTYNGSDQYLTTTGSTNDGTIQYSIDGVNWYNTRRQKTNAGDYDCYWRLVGDSNHTDINSTYLGTTSIAKASRTVSFSSPTTEVQKGSNVTNIASVSAGASDGTLTYSSSNTSVATVNSSGKVTGVSTGSVTITASISAGTNYKAASGSYTISVVPVSYTVNWQKVLRAGYGDFTSFSSSGGNMSYTNAPGSSRVYVDLSGYTFPLTLEFNVVSSGGASNLRAARTVAKSEWGVDNDDLVFLGSGTGQKSFYLTDSSHPIIFYYGMDNNPGMTITGTKVVY